jgi:signal transduction histidine kinase
MPISVELAGTPASDTQRLRHLFESAPVALLEEDYTGVFDRMMQLAADGVQDLDTYLQDDPAALFDLILRVRIVDANPTAVRMLGADTADQLRGPLQVSTVNDGSLRAFREQFIAIWRGETTCSATFEGSDVYGRQVPVRLSLHIPLVHGRPDLAQVMVSMTDVTELVATQRELEHLIRWKDQFTASAAHELRTPVTGIVGIAQLLVEANTLQPGEVTELTTLLVSQAAELERLVEDLMVAGRSGAGQLDIRLEPFAVCHAIADAVKLIDPTTTVDGSDVRAVGDEVRVRQVVRNLLTNALRYGGPHRRVVVSTAADQAVVDVMDDGDEIPAAARLEIFEPFSRGNGKTVEASVGLGLAVSRTLARAQGGDLEYVRIDGWNSFRLSLPTA